MGFQSLEDKVLWGENKGREAFLKSKLLSLVLMRLRNQVQEHVSIGSIHKNVTGYCSERHGAITGHQTRLL
jgi:hypothetical protein